MGTVSQESIDELVSLGYSAEQARYALEQTEGDVDDAIDFLFSKGRKGNRASVPNKAILNTDDDVSVADSIDTQQQIAPDLENAAKQKQASPTRRVSLTELTDNEDVAPVNLSATTNSPTSVLSAPTKMMDDETDSIYDYAVDVDYEKCSLKASTPPSETFLVTTQARQTSRPPNVTPGAFPMHGRRPVTATNNNLVTGGSQQPQPVNAVEAQPLGQVEAELVDPDLENQILEQRLQEKLDQERTKAVVAQVVDEDELKTCHWRRVACVVGVVLVALAIALAVTLTRSPAAPPTPTMAPTFSPLPDAIKELVVPASFDGGASLSDPSSPQSAAARWLAEAHLDNYTDARKLQRYALATLYYSTNGDKWEDKQNWLSDSDECKDWWNKPSDEGGEKKLECDTSGSVTILTIEKNNLQGSLPDEIAFLSNSLFELMLNENVIGGTLSSTLGSMSRLKKLDLRGNNITSTIPSDFGRLTTLETLRLYENELTGTIPSEMALMTSLEDLRLHKNKLDGELVPTIIGSLTKLDTLSLAENDFTGSIPTEIGLLSLLKELKLQRNHLTGELPTRIGLLTLLEKFACHENSLIGALPSEIGLLVALKDEFRAGSNHFNGSIPSEFASLSNLKSLRLGDNNLTGAILSSLGMLPGLKRLELHDNTLSGRLPEELGLLTMMTYLRLAGNNLTGTILSEFSQAFADLKSLSLHNNSFTGTLSPFGNLTALKNLDIGFNILSGSIPSSISRLSSLETLKLSNNALTGTIPQVIYNFTNIQKIHLFNNSFVGNSTCPPTITDCFLSCFDEGNSSCQML